MASIILCYLGGVILLIAGTVQLFCLGQEGYEAAEVARRDYVENHTQLKSQVNRLTDERDYFQTIHREQSEWNNKIQSALSREGKAFSWNKNAIVNIENNGVELISVPITRVVKVTPENYKDIVMFTSDGSHGVLRDHASPLTPPKDNVRKGLGSK